MVQNSRVAMAIRQMEDEERLALALETYMSQRGDEEGADRALAQANAYRHSYTILRRVITEASPFED